MPYCIHFTNSRLFPISFVVVFFRLDNADRFSLQLVPEIDDITGNTVNDKQTEKYFGRIERNGDENQDNQNDGNERYGFADIHYLETVERDIRHHCQTGIQGQNPRGPVKIAAGKPVSSISQMIRQPGAAAARAGQPGKTFVDDFYIGIETGQLRAAQAQKTKAETQPMRPMPFKDHSYTTSAGAAPNATISARLSSCAPNSLCVLVSRATRPSILSKIMEMKMATVACLNSRFRDMTMA